jgi:outer membrane protein assembly factor BamB
MRLLAALLLALALRAQDAPAWPQFRGPNLSGIATSAPPVEFGPSKNLLWKQALPAGHSSPAVWGDRIFLTGFDPELKKLEVICLARKTGAILWRRAVAAPEIEKTQTVSNPATATPAVDGERVYAYFGSSGLAAYDFEGNQKWTFPLPPAKTQFGSGTSPVVTGDLVILNRDEITGGYLVAIDRADGHTVWKTVYESALGPAYESYSTPVVWRNQLVLHRRNFVDAYDVKSGKRLWWVAVSTTGSSSVAVDRDTVYAATFFPLGEPDQLAPVPDFDTVLKKYDKNGDGQISLDELPDDGVPVVIRPDTPNIPGATIYAKSYFARFQSDLLVIRRKDWEGMIAALKTMATPHGVIALRPDGEGDVSKSIAWKESTAIPEVPTPLVYDGRVYLTRNGGIETCLDAQTGKVLYRQRNGAGGPYYSSPIVAGGRIYVGSGEGTVVVFAPGDKLDVLARNDLGEEIFATPAVTEGVLYVRTSGHLWAFGEKK